MGLTNQQLYTTLNNGNQMPLLGLGVYDMHAAEAVHAVQYALEIGYRLIDTGTQPSLGMKFFLLQKSTIPTKVMMKL
jgi:predicted aldo/keto reductase-like oxidoreductase